MIAFQEMINRQMKRPAPHEWQHISLCAKWHAGRHKKINAEVVGIQVPKAPVASYKIFKLY